MIPSNLELTGNSIVVYGATGLVGKAVCLQAHNAGYDVISLGRTKCEKSSDSFKIDFSDYSNLVEITMELLSRVALPKALVFCHRSRTPPHICDADALLLSTAIEINPYLALKEVLQKTSRKGTLNIVTVSSNAAIRYATDVDFKYHIIKHAQVAASIGLSLIPTSLRIFSNVVSFGEVIDSSKKEHDLQHRKLFARLSRFTLNKSVPSIFDVAKVAIMLCEAHNMRICGQTLTVDSGLSSLTQESLVRSLYGKS